MGKLRLLDIFSKGYFMINYILYKNINYSFDNLKIMRFMLLNSSNKVKKTIIMLLFKKNIVMRISLDTIT